MDPRGEAEWGICVSDAASSSAWDCDVGVVQSVFAEVVEVRMSWECHVCGAGGGLVLCSGHVSYVANGVTPGPLSCTVLLLLSGNFFGEAMTMLESLIECSEMPGGGWS